MRPRPLVFLFVVMSVGSSLAAQAKPKGVTRTYYVAAEETDWNYNPSDSDLTMGRQHKYEQYHIVRGPDTNTVAWIFRKAIYREYTDSTFATLKPRDARWQHLEMLGPVLRGAVGDTIVVVFRNRTHFAASMHPHGVFYDKKSEGALYNDGEKDKSGDSVATGGTYRYTWPITERAGPGPNDPSSIVWPYHSHVNELEDVYSGLIGAIIVTRRGMARPDGTPMDVDREFVTMFAATDENTTHFVPVNLKRYTGDTASAGPKGPIGFYQFGYLNINGRMYGNLPVDELTMHVGERVRWYLFSSTGFDDIHSPHWHGNTVLQNGTRHDVIDLDGPLTMTEADMVPDVAGIWLFHCHFGEHMMDGMSGRYRVLP
ncbi:MAG TPA: multicopper oxidase domain-containing protein [Gemmatimonadales bacterium]|nr:multicopper oxidase domain-containing protein [Gemmatimonadales bacterium]